MCTNLARHITMAGPACVAHRVSSSRVRAAAWVLCVLPKEQLELVLLVHCPFAHVDSSDHCLGDGAVLAAAGDDIFRGKVVK